MKRAKRGAGNISLLLRIQKAASIMKKIDKAYVNYPSKPEGLELWKNDVQSIIDSAVFKKE